MNRGDQPGICFGTDGWRGIIADDFTFVRVCQVTRAIATYLASVYPLDHPVFIGYDTRFLAAAFAQTAAEVLSEMGRRVGQVDRDCPTPVLAYYARSQPSAGALMFTASHNPAMYCGLKYIPHWGAPAPPHITDAIAHALSEVSDALPQGTRGDLITSFNPQPAYLAQLKELLDVPRLRQGGLRVKFDALYSVTRGYLDQALRDYGCEVETLHSEPDVLFGGRSPEPSPPQLESLREAVLRDGADLGVATDGDGDRFGILDEQGNYCTPNEILLLLTRHLYQKGERGAIVRTLDTTHALDQLAQVYGLDCYETPVGFKYIGEIMGTVPVLIGGESSGGLSIGRHLPEKDGILANLLVVEAIAFAQKPLSVLIQEAIAEAGGKRYNQRLDFPLPMAQIRPFLENLRATPPRDLAGIPLAKINSQDGLKFYLQDGSWVLLRPSGTEPLLRVSLETDTPQKQEELQQALQAILAPFVGTSRTPNPPSG
ncbi:phosphoglucomutase/phosphomannomutase family protein [Spirulina subsalsa]|uniref:phosphoglucomutase/phosphomannomutase family protein n=1 Tax=Spirulina subsalsa TaxID=54311 RepID=UPI000306C6F8|nr:phosphoglucomutase/phosphomannomutase family protein [Spirulina subsalsa]